MTDVVSAAGRDRSGAVARAAQALRDGMVVAIPTDTVYGLAVDPTKPGATDAIFAAKGRPRSVVLPVLVGDVDDASRLAVVTEEARRLMVAFWPGALTIVLRRADGVDFDLGDEGLTIGLRMPADPVARAVCIMVGPIATTSANRHGGSTPADAASVAKVLRQGVALVVDDGPRYGQPSTVVDCSGDDTRILREGSVSWDEITAALAAEPG
ncbi:MAG: L-threonylcarbamoyladenylate synthase [Acidimicrobiales bacterium]